MDSPALSSEETPRVKFLCSFGGSILPRPQDGKLRYVGGETRIISLPRDISFEELMSRMRELFEGAVVLKYQHPEEDLDALMSVVNDDDLTNMMEEYDKFGAEDGFTRLRMFLFAYPEQDCSFSSSSPHFDSNERDAERRYVDALNSLNDAPPNPFLTADPWIFKMLPDMNHSEVSSLTYSEFPSSSRPEVSSFSVDVPQNLDFVEEQESLQGGNVNTDSIEILLRELSLEKQNRYSYSELREFSSGFKNKIGSGSFGDVYRGHVSSNGMEVAIKVLKKKDFVEQMFVAEIKTVCDTNHENLVKLIGFCLESEKKALVYEYMEKGSLDKILYQKPLGIEWDKLYGIAIDIGKALVYLHHYCKPPIIHYDVKPANVLLDSDHSPKLTDFGLSSVKDREGTYVTMSKTKGTPGFGAPEVWQPFSPGSIKCDVYSFGMLLFEILGTAKNRQKTKWFPKHVWEKFKNGKLNDVIVERGFKEKDRKRAKILSVVALWCIQYTPQTRPTMITVVSVLEKEIAVNNPPNPFETSEFSVSMQPERGSSKKLRNKKRNTGIDPQRKLNG